jgi:4-diphosphocytidyl-2-C-methyl-D-erythritol kinase
MKSIAVNAFAKINLSLRIGERRADGYHDVRTILQSIALADRLVCETRRGPFRFVCSTPSIPSDRSNLVWRAAQQLWTAAGHEGEPRDTAIWLYKRIPTQAGLGGGSSDAAQTLLALRALWKLKVADKDLAAIAGGLGSDVPYFLGGGTALGLGRGEEIFPLAALPRWWVVLVFPPFGVATADAYRWLDEDRSRHEPSPSAETRCLANTWLGHAVPLVNDFEPPVIARYPVIGALIRTMESVGAVLAAMSGSGSTVFGIFTTAKAAEHAAKRLARQGARVALSRMRARPAAACP